MKKFLALVCMVSAFAAFGCDDDDSKNNNNSTSGGSTSGGSTSGGSTSGESTSGGSTSGGSGSSAVCSSGDKKCDGSALYACDASGQWSLSESCANGCDSASNSCKSSSSSGETTSCASGAGSQSAGTVSNGWTYTGCACDSSYAKKCGTVDGKEVVYSCYNNNEEYKACDSCSIDSDGKYVCGGSSTGGGSTTVPSVGSKCDYDSSSDYCDGKKVIYCDGDTSKYASYNCADNNYICVTVENGYGEGINASDCVDPDEDVCTADEADEEYYYSWCDEYDEGDYALYYVCQLTTSGYYYFYDGYDTCSSGCDDDGYECK